MNEVIVTTTNNIEGYVIVEYLQPVTSNVVIGTSMISDLFASFSDLIGTRSNTYQEKFKEMYQLSIEQLKDEARKIGANCILGMKIDLDEISGKEKQMFMINSIGTAVIIKERREYDLYIEDKRKRDEKKQEIEDAKNAKFKSIEDIINDEEFSSKANELKRIYGERVYKEFIEKKAEELGVKY